MTLSIEEIRLITEKLEKIDKQDLQKVVQDTLKIFQGLITASDAYNETHIKKFDKPAQWYKMDVEVKRKNPVVDPSLFRQIQTKIFQFGKSNLYNSLEIGPGVGMFSKEFRAWRLNYFLDILPHLEEKIRRRFPPPHQKYLKFFTTRKTECSNIPQGSCNFVFSWDTFVFFSKDHIQQYLHDIKRVLIKGGYVCIHYTDCHYDYDLQQANRSYWNYNNKALMEQMIINEGYDVVEMNQFRPGANYAVFRKPGKQNPVIYGSHELNLE